ncbi:MAG: CcmD family protein [Bacillota bacterium]|nr:CcmD family protein [Bacillota bacterium]
MAWVALAYGLIWLGLAAYIVRLAVATRRLEGEVRRLESTLPEEPASAPVSGEGGGRGPARRQEGSD